LPATLAPRHQEPIVTSPVIWVVSAPRAGGAILKCPGCDIFSLSAEYYSRCFLSSMQFCRSCRFRRGRTPEPPTNLSSEFTPIENGPSGLFSIPAFPRLFRRWPRRQRPWYEPPQRGPKPRRRRARAKLSRSSCRQNRKSRRPSRNGSAKLPEAALHRPWSSRNNRDLVFLKIARGEEACRRTTVPPGRVDLEASPCGSFNSDVTSRRIPQNSCWVPCGTIAMRNCLRSGGLYPFDESQHRLPESVRLTG
jgi:hypothetical protein